jgi:hypothetical protein
MNTLRHIFSFKLVVVFALVAFLGAVPKAADARLSCPCPFATLYKASVKQAKSLGETNKVDVCFKDSDQFRIEGGALPPENCFTGMGIFNLTSTPVCDYLYVCDRGSDPGYAYEVIGEEPFGIHITPTEMKACRAELLTIAWLSGLLPCQTPPGG